MARAHLGRESDGMKRERRGLLSPLSPDVGAAVAVLGPACEAALPFSSSWKIASSLALSSVTLAVPHDLLLVAHLLC